MGAVGRQQTAGQPDRLLGDESTERATADVFPVGDHDRDDPAQRESGLALLVIEAVAATQQPVRDVRGPPEATVVVDDLLGAERQPAAHDLDVAVHRQADALREWCSGGDRMLEKRGGRCRQTIELARLKSAAWLAGVQPDIGQSPVRDHVVHVHLHSRSAALRGARHRLIGPRHRDR